MLNSRREDEEADQTAEYSDYVEKEREFVRVRCFVRRGLTPQGLV
jgi:hypothetical protein